MLQNKTIIIAGGAGLIGSAFSRACAKQNAHVVIVDINKEKGESLVEHIRKETKNEHVLFQECNLASGKDITRVIQTTLEKFKKIDALVNSAFPKNKNYGKKFEDVSFEDFCENITMHLGCYFLITREVAKVMKKQNSGNIVNVASIYGVIAPKFEIYEGTQMTSAVEYAAIKGGVVQLTLYLASYLGKYHIRVNAISPGGVSDNQPEPFVKKYSQKVLLGNRMAEPSDLTGTLIFLLSDASAYITGQNIIVDGGFTLS